ncbi:MAG: hypothetical protein HUK16_00295 [Bacteroidales bacterium]|nr:hypothetical protein [Bacteroidales bacterium]
MACFLSMSRTATMLKRKTRGVSCSLILLASYSTKDLSDSGLKVVSIYGTCDGVLDKEAYEQNRPNLPQNTVEQVVEGGCHSYFAWYVHQQGDGTPTISRERQIENPSKIISNSNGRIGLK